MLQLLNVITVCLQSFEASDFVKMGTDSYTWRIIIGCFCAKLCNTSLNLASHSSCFKGFVTCLSLSQLTISSSVLKVLLLSTGFEPNPYPDVAIDCISLTPSHVSVEPSIQLLEDCHLTNEQVIEVTENFLRA